jgi:flagellar hook-basal body complex protein FliE
MARAKKMHLVKEMDRRGTFNFTNKDIQEALYNELDEETRQALHKKIGELIKEKHKDDLYDVASELSFHFAKLPQSEEAARYARLIREKAESLFNPNEILDYLNELSQEQIISPEEEKVTLTPKAGIEINRLIKIFMSAVKNFQLYPQGSSIRKTFIKDIYQSLSQILEETEKLNIIESEGTLIINGRRYSAREIHDLGAEDFISLLVEGDIKSVSFMKGVTEEEVGIFIENLSLGRTGISEKGGWKNIVQEEKLAHIKIGEFIYEGITKTSFSERKGRKKFEDAMIMEFLLGKIAPETVEGKSFISKISTDPGKFAQALNRMAEEVGKKEKSSSALKSIIKGIEKINLELSKDDTKEVDVASELSKVILELDWRLKNKFIRSQPEIIGLNKKNITKEIIARLPDEEIVKLIEDSYVHGLTNPLCVKDLIDKSLPNTERKQDVLPKISTKLSELGINKEVRDYLTGTSSWQDLPIKERLDSFINLPQEEFETINMGLFSEFLEELLNKNKDQEIQVLFKEILNKSSDARTEIKEKIKKVIIGFIKADGDIFRRSRFLLEILKSEYRSKIFISVLNIIKQIIEEFINSLDLSNLYSEVRQPKYRGYNNLISKTFDILERRMRSKEARDIPIQESIREFIYEILNLPEFLSILALSCLEYFGTSVQRIKEILELFENKAVSPLIDICLNQEKLIRDSFEGYALRKRVSGILREMGKIALDKIMERLTSESSEEDMLIILELAGNLKSNELIDGIEPYVYHANLELRKQAILALSNIGSDKAKEILANVASSEKNAQIRLFAQKILNTK